MFLKTNLVFYPEMWPGGEVQLVKLSNSGISRGKYVRSELVLLSSICVYVWKCVCISSQLEVCLYFQLSLWAVPS